jgi:hypothetical protein
MKRWVALVLAATFAVEAPAQTFKAARTPVMPVAPKLGAAVTPGLAAPALSATLPSAPVLLPKASLSASVAVLPVVAAAPAAAPAAAAPVASKATLEAAQASLAETPAAPKSAEGGWTAGRAAFDAGSAPSAGAPAVALPPVSTPRSGLARPSAFANQVSGRSTPEAPRSGAKVRALEFVETALYGGGVALLSFAIASAVGATFPLLLGPVMGLTSHVSSRTMFDQLGGLRGKVVDGWQASHDQRYRVGGDGQLRDVRGHKYGADRYERYAPGPVGRTASLLIRAAAAATGAVWLLGAGLTGWALYAAVFVGLEILAARSRARAVADTRPMGGEGAAHAARFQNR